MGDKSPLAPRCTRIATRSIGGNIESRGVLSADTGASIRIVLKANAIKESGMLTESCALRSRERTMSFNPDDDAEGSNKRHYQSTHASGTHGRCVIHLDRRRKFLPIGAAAGLRKLANSLSRTVCLTLNEGVRLVSPNVDSPGRHLAKRLARDVLGL